MTSQKAWSSKQVYLIRCLVFSPQPHSLEAAMLVCWAIKYLTIPGKPNLLISQCMNQLQRKTNEKRACGLFVRFPLQPHHLRLNSNRRTAGNSTSVISSDIISCPSRTHPVVPWVHPAVLPIHTQLSFSLHVSMQFTHKKYSRQLKACLKVQTTHLTQMVGISSQ